MNERVTSRFTCGPAILVLIGVVAGCSNTTSEPAIGGAEANVAIDLVEVGRDDYERIITENRGKVILVDFWATWCLPCLQQFPHTVELAKNSADRGLVVITVSLDDPADAERVIEFLRTRQASGLINLVSRFGGGTRSVEAFDIPGGAVPHYKLYNRAGELQATFALDPTAERQFTTDDIDAAVADLLDQEGTEGT